MVRAIRIAVVVTFMASALVVAAPGAHAESIPETLADRAAVRVGAVDPAFAIDYVGVFWDVPADADAHAHAADDEHSHDNAPHGEIRLRHAGRWAGWIPLVEDGAQAEGRWTGNLVPAGDAEAYQVRGVPEDAIRPQAVALNTTDGPAREVRVRPASAQALPACVSRYDWGADETLGTKNRAYADVQVMTVHHTATTNDDLDPKATVRAIHRYHTVDNGWDDIGYNYLVDESGRLYEGRWSGADSEPCESDPQNGPGVAGVVGDGADFAHNDTNQLVTAAHSGGYNTGNVGVALLGDFRDHPRYGADPKDAAVASLEDTLADLGQRHGFTAAELRGDTKTSYDNGVNQKTVYAISAHRDFTSTECPGQRLYDRLSTIRQNTADKLGGNAAPNVTISEPADGTVVASGSIVRFTAEVTDDDTTSGDVVWTAGGQTLAVGGTFETTLPDGTHTVTATITDAGGLSDSASVDVTWGTVEATPNYAPTASFKYTCTDLGCSFDGTGSSDSDGTITAYAWDLGDNSTATGATASHTYAAAGTYTVTLTVTDDDGATGVQSQTLTVTAPATGAITLSAKGYKVKGTQHADLTWSGTAVTSVDVYRNGTKIMTTANDGAHTDNTGNKGSGSYTYKVCEAGTTTCSNEATVTFS